MACETWLRENRWLGETVSGFEGGVRILIWMCVWVWSVEGHAFAEFWGELGAWFCVPCRLRCGSLRFIKSVSRELSLLFPQTP